MVERRWLRVSQNGLQAQPHGWMFSIFRAISGVVITGIETILADDPQLNVRQLQGVADLTMVVQPKRLVLDRQGRLPLTAQILQQPDTVMVMGPYRQALADLGVLQFAVQPLDQLLKAVGSIASNLRCHG